MDMEASDVRDDPEEADYEVEDDEQPAEVVVTPLLTSDAVVDLMADSVPQEDIAWRSEKIRRGIGLTFPNVDDSTVPDEELVAATIREKISWASGESDTESIRDLDSGSSRT